MKRVEDLKRLDEIVSGASNLPTENQEYILATIRGMLFTRGLFINNKEMNKNNRNVT